MVEVLDLLDDAVKDDDAKIADVPINKDTVAAEVGEAVCLRHHRLQNRTSSSSSFCFFLER